MFIEVNWANWLYLASSANISACHLITGIESNSHFTPKFKPNWVVGMQNLNFCPAEETI